MEAAERGETWLLLPEGYRAQEYGKKYPLPSRRRALHKLAGIYTPPNKNDSGCIYLKRCVAEHKKRQQRQQSASLEIDRETQDVKTQRWQFTQTLQQMEADAEQAVEGVRQTAARAVATMSSLFALGREGMEGMMKAHLAEEKWKGEPVGGAAFRQCFRMVTQTVKGLGLPDEERKGSRKAIMEEVAASVEATRKAVALAPSEDDGTEH